MLEQVLLAPGDDLTPLQEFAGLITFVNVFLVLGSIAVTVCFAYLFGSYVKDLMKVLKNVPYVVYEVVFYAIGVGLLLWGLRLGDSISEYVGLTGCLLVMAALGFSATKRKFARDPFRFSGILFVVWTAAAVVYGSSLLGFFAVAALLSALGFSVVASPLSYTIGFRDDKGFGRATTAAFVILAGFVGIRVSGAHTPTLAVFEFGALFLGSFVGYLGLLIASSRWYEDKGNYVLFQVVTILAGVAALLVGSVFGIGELQKIGGTFFVLYLIEKFFEVPVEGKRARAGLGLLIGAVTLGIGFLVKTHPDAVAGFLFLP